MLLTIKTQPHPYTAGRRAFFLHISRRPIYALLPLNKEICVPSSPAGKENTQILL